jgi:hypothetical protein
MCLLHGLAQVSLKTESQACSKIYTASLTRAMFVKLKPIVAIVHEEIEKKVFRNIEFHTRLKESS